MLGNSCIVFVGDGLRPLLAKVKGEIMEPRDQFNIYAKNQISKRLRMEAYTMAIREALAAQRANKKPRRLPGWLFFTLGFGSTVIADMVGHSGLAALLFIGTVGVGAFMSLRQFR